MNKKNLISILFSLSMLLGCSKDSGLNPVELNEPIFKDGTISSPESWAQIDSVYRIVKDCVIESEVKWEKGIHVSIDSSVVVKIRKNGLLNIDEGVKISIGKDAYFDVGTETRGTLIANGSEDSPILFKASSSEIKWGLKSSDTQGGGIILGDSAADIKLDYCSITDVRAGIYVKSGTPVITNCQIKDCGGNGVYFDSTENWDNSLTFKNNTISDCGGYPLVLPAYKLGNLSSKNSFTKDDSKKNAICVLGGCITDTNAVWGKMDIPYVFIGRTLIGSDKGAMVTIKPGTICKFEKNASLRVGDPGFGVGALIAKGTETDSIYFTNNVAGEFWGEADMYTGGTVYGLWVGLEAPLKTTFEYCSIKNATNGIGIVSVVPRVTISNCLITGCQNNGVEFLGGGIVDSLSFVNNVFTQNGGYGIRITADQLVNISGSISVNNNGKNGIYVCGSSVGMSGVWKNCGTPYVVDGVIEIGVADGVKITIEPGTEFRFLNGSGISVGFNYPGRLVAKGTESKSIVFTSYKDDEPWGIERDEITCGVRIEEKTDSKTELTYCDISNTSSGAYINANVKVKNCNITDCHDYGLIYGKKSDSELISDNTFSGNGKDKFKVE